MIQGAADSFDKAVVSFVRRWLGGQCHTLSRRVARRADLVPGRGLALVIEGIPLIGRHPGREWDFLQCCDWSPVPTEGNGTLSLGGRVRWYAIGRREPAQSIVLFADARYPDHAGRDMVRRYLDADPRHIALFEETCNADGRSVIPGRNHEIVVFRGEVMHLVTASTTDEEIENAWDAASGYGGGELVGLLTSLPDGRALAPGDAVPETLLDALAARVEGIFLKAFDGDGLLVWAVGDQPPPWSDVR